MKKIYTNSDIGSVAVDCGNKNVITFSNDYGDGETKVYIFEDGKEFAEYEENHKQYFNSKRIQFISIARFNNAEILYSDCAGIDGSDIFDFDRTGEKLNGSYAIYNWCGKVYFVRN